VKRSEKQGLPCCYSFLRLLLIDVRFGFAGVGLQRVLSYDSQASTLCVMIEDGTERCRGYMQPKANT
jgi:hypothetical protein